MKKLMTIFASAATLCAVGVAKGEKISGTGFETEGANPAYVAGLGLDTTKDDAGLQAVDLAFAKTWLDVGALDSAIVTNYGGPGAAVAAEVAAATDVKVEDLGSNYLMLDSADLVTRYAKAGADNTVELTAEGIYIDTLVKFTPSEDTEPETTAGDKLCIWVNVDQETGATNLMVRAGYITNHMGATVPTNYVVTGAFPSGNIEGWHRLTVIAYSDIDEDAWLASGFAIKIDGNLVGTELCPFADASKYTFNDNVAAYMASSPYKLFPSLVSLSDDDGSGSSTSLTSIGFKGSGCIDNLQFTTDNPIPTPEPVTYELTITATGDATNTTYTATTNGTAVATGDFIVNGQEVVVVVTPNNGWEYASTPTDWSAGAAAGTITKTFTVSGAALEITIPAPTAKSSGYDSGDGKTFVIPTEKETALKAALPSGATTLADTVSATSDLTYAQAYALGLWDENAKEVADLDATITVGADGKVTVTLANAPAEGFLVTCKVYEKASLTAAEWTLKKTYTYGSEEVAFTPGSTTAGFYKVEVVISNALQD